MVATMNQATDMDVEGTPNLEGLYSNDEEICLQAVSDIKSSLIGSNKEKRSAIERGVAPRLINILNDPNFSTNLKIVVAYTLGSLAKGLDYNIKTLIDLGVVPALLLTISHNDTKLVEACLACLKTVFQHPDAPVDHIYSDANIVPHLISLMVQSPTNQISVSVILCNACKSKEHQDILARHGLVTALNILLCSPYPDVLLPALQCLAFLVSNNEEVSRMVATSSYNDKPLLSLIVQLMDRNKRIEMQLAAATCLTHICRCGVIQVEDTLITYKTLPCLVRMTKKEELVEHRLVAADALASLIEASAFLQKIAAISNHLIASMASFLTWEANDMCNNNNINNANRSCKAQDSITSKEMKTASFRVFAALGANDEEIRKKVIDTEHLMPSLVQALEDSANPKLQMAAVGCLHSLSRSVQLLRTTFQDHPVWKPLMKILSSSNSSSSSVRPWVLASSTLCNLLLEFSPSKEPILDSGAVEMLCLLTHKYEHDLRLNGVWGLMNMAFQAEQRIKVQIIKSLGSDQIFRLLSDQDINVVMKTLGLLRNLLANKQHIDHIMSSYGTQIMQAVVLILESDNSPEVKEQALCILANIADGNSAKHYIMSNEDVLKKVTNYMVHSNSNLQVAAVVCIQNLSWAEDEGAADRQVKLRDFGIYRILQSLLSTTEPNLFEKVKVTLQQFP